MIKTIKDYLSNGGLNELKGKKFGLGNLKQKDHYQIYKILDIYQENNFDFMRILILESNVMGLNDFSTEYLIEGHLNDIEVK